MKLLFDENISFRIVKKSAEIFPDSIHVTDVSPLLASDAATFQYAKENEFMSVTFDEDFIDLQALRGFPPKVIWLRMGNSSTLSVLYKLSENTPAIRDLSENVQHGTLEIY
jgi:predicted nuclease of predicted toxin-antitoxin system